MLLFAFSFTSLILFSLQETRPWDLRCPKCIVKPRQRVLGSGDSEEKMNVLQSLCQTEGNGFLEVTTASEETRPCSTMVHLSIYCRFLVKEFAKSTEATLRLLVALWDAHLCSCLCGVNRCFCTFLLCYFINQCCISLVI
jgi:hypothetical protein